ncbi:MAG: NAD(P)/FAD-dependent oxidoreductase [Ardenticatenaceae bacterium]|nr:NAD(P)/FAD-dependent oxidoreductase [Anaerolineales bacterium]MCB8921995.1 NAD(P)/FAD-dependent oxidoreductase [Ardenticatenaceae bacterium]MCB8989571.1 NAD(P)/FAD-dependent oxidoreductase [Ardenticatenaceae bacterium]MCB9003114.1 NAD(P)/FAD-dependent oxidoreductase [Ardenticatenaceae bacterium]
MSPYDYDTIVIGSGAGGLATAVALAQSGQKVLVCEQHEVPGGWTHSFTLEGYRFSPGVHYIGGIGPGGHMRRIYEGLGVSQDLPFCELNPDGYDHILAGGERFDIPKGRERFAARLKERFPHEAAGIDGYLQTIDKLQSDLHRANSVGGILQARTLLRWGFRTGQAAIDHFVQDPFLKAILSAQSGDHGLPPSMVSAPVHMGITNHYFEGGYYPLGGAFAIPRAFVRALKRAGGEIRLSTAVQRILLQNGKVTGVQLADGSALTAQNVVSNADPEMTFGKLIGRENLPWRLRRKVNRADYSVSAISLFFAVDMDLRAAGLDSGNLWFYRHNNVDQLYKEGLAGKIMHADRADGLFLTVTTLKDPSKMHSGHHTLEAFCFTNYAPFAKWANQPEGNRGAEYSALKSQLADKMLATIDEIVPGIREHVVFCDLGTPLTNQHYLAAHQGNLYGTAKSPFQMGPLAFPIKAPLDGLWLCGASTLSHGVAGATASGLAAAKGILRCRTSDLLQQNGPELQIYPSEDISQWPDELQAKIALRNTK